MACNEIFQYSMASALMDGVASHGLPIAELLQHGNHGLGTFRWMNGEMILIDGALYAMKSDATVQLIDPAGDAVHPFAQVTRFQASKSTRAKLNSKQHLFEVISKILPDCKNHFIGIRITGTFKAMEVRTGGGQEHPRESLIEIGRRQRVFNFQHVTGTMVGFRNPAYMHGIGVEGDHLHFITDDRTRGGHLLGVETDEEVLIEVSPISRLVLDLPRGDGEFNSAQLGEVDQKGLAKVEG